jgi:acyl-CoA dehydrogenase
VRPADGTEVTSEDVAEGLFRFIDSEVMPLQRRLDEFYADPRRYWADDGRLAPEIVDARRQARMASAQAGYYSMFCPIELGGGGLGATIYFDVWEELCHRYGSPQTQLPFFVLAHTSTGPTALWQHASAELKEDLLPRLLAGEVQGAFAMSEPEAGSDAWMMRSTATPSGDGWILNGEKQWASWAPTAEFVITFAVTDAELFRARRGGLTAFYVPTATPGYRLDSLVRVFEEPGSEHCVIGLEDCWVPDRYRLGPVGAGFAVAMQGSDQLKLTKLGRTIGLTRWALERAVGYAAVRRTFGQALADHGTVRDMLARSSIDIYAARLMARDIAAKIDRGLGTRGQAAMAHAFTAEAMYQAYDQVMQVFGGMSLTNDLGLINGWHHLRIARISEGPTEVQLRTVARHLFGGTLEF